MAHSYGGAVVLELVCDIFVFYILLIMFLQASRYAPEFERRVFAVALSDSPMIGYAKHFSKNVLKMLKKVLIFIK